MRHPGREPRSGRVLLAIAVAAMVVGGLLIAFAVGSFRHHTAQRQPDVAGRTLAPGEFPDAATTGVPAGTTLTKVPGDATSGAGWQWNRYGWVQVTASGAAISRLDIDGSLHSSKPDVTISDTRVRCTGENDWCVSIGTNSTVRDSEIGGQADGHTFGKAAGLVSAGSQAHNLLERLNIHNTSDGLRLDGGTQLLDSWVHDLSMGDIPDAHSDGVQSTGGDNVTVSGNRIETGNNCNVFVQWLSGQPTIGNYTVKDNMFVSGNRNGQQTSYGVCMYGKGVSAPIAVVGNTFSRGWQVGALTVPPEATVSGNSYTDGSPATPVSG